MYPFIFYSFAIWILYILIITIKRRVQYDLHKIPKAPIYPIIGHLHHFIGQDKPKISVWLYKWFQKLGQPPLLLMDTMFSKVVVIIDNSCSHEKVYPHDGYPKAKDTYHSVSFVIDDKKQTLSLFTILEINPYWKAVRKAVAASFSTESLRKKFPIILSCLNKFEDVLMKMNNPFEGQFMFSLLTLSIIMNAEFEYDYDIYNKGESIIEDFKNCISNSNVKIFFPIIKKFTQLFPNSSISKKLGNRYLRLREVSKETLLHYRQKKDIDENNTSIIANLSKVIDPDTGKKLSDFDILGEIFTGIAAGFSTTGNQLAWIFTLISLHPKCEEKILEELKNHNFIGTNSKELEYNDLSKLTYLDAFIKECMRMANTVLFGTIRQLPCDDVICGYRVPKGTVVIIFNKGIHRLESNFEKPNDFIPERWLGKNVTELTKNICNFSFGPRKCVGMQLALTEIMATVVYLLSKYKISFINEEKKSLDELLNETYDNFALTHESGLYFEIKNRFC